MDLHRDGNFIEAGVWLVVAALVMWKRRQSPAICRSTLLLLAVTLVLFGASDVVEAGTGAWWRPWWLLMWKTICVVMLILGGRRYFQLNKGERVTKEKDADVVAK